MSFSTDTPVTVTLTMGKIYAVLAGFVALLAAIIIGVWVVTTSTVGDIRKDVGDIRKGLADNVKTTNDVNLALTKEIAGLLSILLALVRGSRVSIRQSANWKYNLLVCKIL
jgi:hypothetical protein